MADSNKVQQTKGDNVDQSTDTPKAVEMYKDIEGLAHTNQDDAYRASIDSLIARNVAGAVPQVKTLIDIFAQHSSYFKWFTDKVTARNKEIGDNPTGGRNAPLPINDPKSAGNSHS